MAVEDMWQDRMPPQDIQAEQAVLGSIFLAPDELINAMEVLGAKDFYQRRHQLIYQAMINLFDRNEAIDVVTLKAELERGNALEDVGSVGYLVELSQATPYAGSISFYAKIVADKALLRNLIQAANKIVAAGYEQDEDVSAIVEDAERGILEVSERRNSIGFQAIEDVLQETFRNIDQLAQNDEEITGIPTGYPALDKMTAGLQQGELIILAARPAVGKTAFALNIAQNIGTKTDASVAIFSLEMDAESLVKRMLCAEGLIDAGHLKTGQLTDEEWGNLVVAMGSLSRASIFIDDTPGIKVSEIRARCRRLAQEKKDLGLILIDYLQLIEGTGRENRQQEVSEISRQLKKLAKELKVPVIALSQLSRGVEQRQDKRPVMSDIRESGSIEQDADIVAFLYRDDYYQRDSDDPDEQDDTRDNIIEVIIEKNRSGARGTVELMFIKEYNKFSSLSLRDDAM
ncbi:MULTISPECIES: replicative DNA helicase [Enterococcus]|jgi:replicative DNA helicase|uniref:Replicative DNA helicase n=1 Tax=Enterococcus dispar ATCC 51266 TaxID=1139219 RepID=S0KM33_9ENTE|nr:replicative DNA helicase [Enterococcus dispar]EOT40256.1 replicative DNA helicase [Enterococcus dispar ATCC 51266]EOW86461.1 replicative DNA helicase [Enterococcus dispar ATCC 51266]MCU7357372.1 replicative DNA helicase [Enterococcus dispar]MDT2706041.1 replicative DNA helicase [Enterococcus dispar]OJG39580.1 replicative DNA helicase [Enterococcus dispar]